MFLIQLQIHVQWFPNFEKCCETLFLIAVSHVTDSNIIWYVNEDVMIDKYRFEQLFKGFAIKNLDGKVSVKKSGT